MTGKRRTIEYHGNLRERIESGARRIYRRRRSASEEALIRAFRTNLDGQPLSDFDLQTIASERLIPAGYWEIVAGARRPVGHWLWWSDSTGLPSSWSANHWSRGNGRTACGIEIETIRTWRKGGVVLHLDERIPDGALGSGGHDCRVCLLASQDRSGALNRANPGQGTHPRRASLSDDPGASGGRRTRDGG